MTLHQCIFAGLVIISLLFFQRCTSPNASVSICKTSVDEEMILLVDSLEANIATLGVDSLERLITGLKEANVAPIGLAYAQYRRGVQDHVSRNPAGAISWYEQALLNYQQCPDADPARVAMLYKNLAGKYFDHELQYRLGYKKATEGIEYLKTLPVNNVAEDLHFELFLMAGRNKVRLGDAQLALTYFDLAHIQLPFDSVSYYLHSQMADEKAMAFFYLNKLDSAAYYNQLAERIILQQSDLVFWDTLDLANVYNNACIIYDLKQRDSLAFLSLQKSIVFNRKVGDTLKLAGNLNNLGVLYKKRDQCDKGLVFFREAKQLYKTLEYDYGLAQIEDNLGDCYQQKEQLNQALQKYEQAIQLFHGGEESSVISDARYRTGLYEPLVSRARVLLKLQGGNEGAVQPELWRAYARVDTLLQAMRFDYTDERSKIYTQARIKPVYEEMIALCHQGWKNSTDVSWVNRAIAYFERSKHLVLEEAIAQDKVLKQVLSEEHYEKERELEQLGAYFFQQSLNGRLSFAERKEFQNRQYQTELELRQLRDTLRQQYPQYQSYQSLVEAPRLKDIQHFLKADDQLIEYFVGVDAIYSLAISKDEIRFEKLAKGKSEISDEIQAFRKALEYPLYPGESSAKNNDLAIRERAYLLYDQLLTPALNSSRSKRLIVIPDDVLAYLPFEALLTRPVIDTKAEMFHQYPFLIKKYTVNYQFSLVLWQAIQQKQTPVTTKGTLVMVPSQRESYEVLLTDQTQITLPSLGYTKEETVSISAFGKVRVLSGSQATKRAFFEEVPHHAVIHFAGHGNADPQDAYRSFLAFNLKGADQQNDELLFLPELYTMNIPAEMLVLSACQTADGRLAAGEGVLSLTRGATLAGAKSVVSSLWLVNQQSKIGLIDQFYEHLSLGNAKDVALRKAKLNYLKQADSPWSHPYHWAGMVVIGNPRPLKDLL